MAATHWHVCDDYLVPLSQELLQLGPRFILHFDVARRDAQEAEFNGILSSAGFQQDKLSEEQRGRLDALAAEMKLKPDPPSAVDFDLLMHRYRVDLAGDWLKVNLGLDYGGEFSAQLSALHRRLAAVEFRACQILNGDIGGESTLRVRYAVQRIHDRHGELLRQAFPGGEYPCGDEMPTELRAVETDILDEYSAIGWATKALGDRMMNVASMIGAKLAPAPPGAGSSGPARASCQERMAGILLSNADAMWWSAEQWATATGFSPSAVKGTNAWATIMAQREVHKCGLVERADRRRKPGKR